MTDINHYGIKHTFEARDDIDHHIESLRLNGYAVVPGTLNANDVSDLSKRLDALYQKQCRDVGGEDVLRAIKDVNTVRLPLADDEAFLALATCPTILSLARRMMDGYIILNQQNATINQPNEVHPQSFFHRDLPYQHFTSSAPMAINAVFCVDPFRADNGATWVVPASHHWDSSPSLEGMKRMAIQVTAPAGSYVVMNSMMFHAAGQNHSTAPRRGINNVYVRGFMRQQIDIPEALGGRYSDNPELAQLLGYKDKASASVRAWRQMYIDRLTTS